jgi:hypothetical protein
LNNKGREGWVDWVNFVVKFFKLDSVIYWLVKEEKIVLNLFSCPYGKELFHIELWRREDWVEFIFVSLRKRIISYWVVKKRRLSWIYFRVLMENNYFILSCEEEKIALNLFSWPYGKELFHIELWRREDCVEFIFVTLRKRIISYWVVKKRRLRQLQCISLQNLISTLTE